jgi:BolA protein
MRLLQLLTSMLALRRGLAMSATAGPRELRITQALTSAFAPQHLEVLNESHGRREDESHFKVVVVSDRFDGVKPLIKRHRLVTAAITADTGGALDFHSLSVAVAKTPAEWGSSSAVAASPKCAGGDGRGAAR